MLSIMNGFRRRVIETPFSHGGEINRKLRTRSKSSGQLNISLDLKVAILGAMLRIIDGSVNGNHRDFRNREFQRLKIRSQIFLVVSAAKFDQRNALPLTIELFWEVIQLSERSEEH